MTKAFDFFRSFSDSIIWKLLRSSLGILSAISLTTALDIFWQLIQHFLRNILLHFIWKLFFMNFFGFCFKELPGNSFKNFLEHFCENSIENSAGNSLKFFFGNLFRFSLDKVLYLKPITRMQTWEALTQLLYFSHFYTQSEANSFFFTVLKLQYSTTMHNFAKSTVTNPGYLGFYE